MALDKIIKTYNATAARYAATRIDELSKKNFDRMILKEFATVNKSTGLCADFGCGPGHVAKFLSDHGMNNIIGVDISPEMISVAQRYFPGLRFETGDLLALPYGDGHFGSAVAFYAIVNLDKAQVDQSLQEIARVLRSGGQFLLSFHVGNEIIHFDEADGIDVDVDMYLWPTEQIVAQLEKNNFILIDAIERRPYPDVEFQTRRGYVWVERK